MYTRDFRKTKSIAYYVYCMFIEKNLFDSE